jgi:phenylacetate-CoA ligase
MGLYPALLANLLFPLQEKLKKNDTVAIRKAMDDSQWWQPEKLEEFRFERLLNLLVTAGIHVPCYRDSFARQGFDPQAIRSVSGLPQLPFLTKSAIRTEGDRMKSNAAQGLAHFNTGEASGEHLIFSIGKARVSHDVAAKWRATRWWNVDIGDPEIVVWGSPIELGAQDRVRQVRDHLFRTQLLSAFEMSERKLDQFVAIIRATRPKMLFGYPSALKHIAQHAEKNGIVMSDLGIKVAFVTSERLYDDQCETISRIFQCKVANGYGSRDAGFIAHECPSGGMHITAEDVIVEIVNEVGEVLPAGVSGEIVVTHLTTKDFPFIRYCAGDIGILGEAPCSCGRGLPVLKEIQGRSTDFVIAADGTVMHGLALVYLLRDLLGVKSFKVIQESRQQTRVLLVTNSEFVPPMVEQIISGFRQHLGSNVDVLVEIVDTVPAEKSGKFRYVVSHAGQQKMSEAHV